MIKRILAALALVILGSIASQELFKALTPMMPYLLIAALVAIVAGGWIQSKRKL